MRFLKRLLDADVELFIWASLLLLIGLLVTIWLAPCEHLLRPMGCDRPVPTVRRAP